VNLLENNKTIFKSYRTTRCKQEDIKNKVLL